jgi:YHS domain-containing protein
MSKRTRMKSDHPIISKKGFYIYTFTLLVLVGIFFSCNQKPNPETTSVAINKSDSGQKKFTVSMVDNKKDPSCGMPLTAGIEDTLHYDGKVYGFCSDECKQIFLKDPKTLAKNAEMKN